MEKRDNKILRIAITGPESSGKTDLWQYLCHKFEVSAVPDISREYLSRKKQTGYTFEDVKAIARLQLQSEKEAEKLSRPVLCDTDMIVVKIWMKEKFGKVSPEVEEEITHNPFDLYFLCKPDIPWEPDPLRENPFDRDYLFELYLEELKKIQARFIIIEGTREKRYKLAFEEFEKLGIKKSPS